MGRGTTIVITPVSSINDIEAVRALFRHYGESLSFSLAFQDFEAELAGLPAPYVPPRGSLLIAKGGLEYLGAVGLKHLSVGIAEIKRLYVVPEARRCGVGRMLLTRIIDDASLKGYERVRLDSHRPSMTAAIAIYRSLGFVEIAPYGPDLDGEIAFFEKSFGSPTCK
jgi:putative acetyltransferase